MSNHINSNYNKNKFLQKKLIIVSKYKQKYKKYSNYITNDFIEKEFLYFSDIYNNECSINPEILFGIYIKNKIIKRLVEFINEGYIDLEIELIEEYLPILNHIYLKLGITEEQINKEEVLITALETYEGNKLFILYVIDIIRKIQTKNSNNEISFEQKIENYIKNNQINPRKLSQIDLLIIKFELINTITDDLLKQYIYLKYGYYKGIYFKDEDIKILLNISNEEINNMYIEILYLLKKYLNKNIDLIISNDFNIHENKKYVKIKKDNV